MVSFTQVSAGGRYSCGLRTDSSIKCWGDNRYGQSDPPGGSFTQVSAGGAHSCGLRTDGSIECWGDNRYGQSDPPGGSFTQVSAGDRYSCGLRTDGSIECWGILTFRTAKPAVGGGPSGEDTVSEDAGVHQPSVDALNQHVPGIFDGTGCGQGLCPSDALQRWEMAVWLVRVLDRANPSQQASTRFDDVDSGLWWAAHTDRLAELEVTAGCATGPLRFCPDRAVTRAQMATFLVRAFNLDAAPSAGFADTAGTTHEANIDALATAGVTAGCETDPLRYCPDKPVTRAQMATFLARALGII